MFQDTVVRAGDLIADVVGALDPDAVSGSSARELWAAFDRAERLYAAGKTLLARRIAATHQRSGGTRSAAEELSRRSGSSSGQRKTAWAPPSGCRTSRRSKRRYGAVNCRPRRWR